MITTAAPAARPATYPRPHTDPPQLTAALAYGRRGWPVFPCKPRDKRPLLADWPNQASTDPATIRAWWQKYPHANVAIVPPPGLVVMDIDAKANGIAWLEGPGAALCPPTLTSETGGGGLHLLYTVPRDAPIRQSAGEIAPGVDVRAAGRGYIIAPPSLHPSGGLYHWRPGAGPDDTAPAAAPPALLALLAPPPPPEPAAAAALAAPADARPSLETLLEWAVKRAAIGNRNPTGFALARQCQANGYSEGETESVMRQYQQRVTTGADPYTWHEARASLRSAYRYAPLAPWDRGAQAPAPHAPPDAAELARVVSAVPDADGVIGEVDAAALLPNLLAELAALRLELQEERAARLAAEAKAADADARARFVREWLRVPNVLPAVKTTAPFVAWQYQQKVSAGDVDADGWVHLSPFAVVDAQLPPGVQLPEKEMRQRAEQIGTYVKDMGTKDDGGGLHWLECRHGEYTHVNGHIARPLYVRPVPELRDAFLTTPAALPFPPKRTARPVKAAPCPKCQSSKTKILVLCECSNCGHVFAPPADETTEAADAETVSPDVLAAAALAVETIPPARRSQEDVTNAIKAWRPPKAAPVPAGVDPKLSDLETGGAYRSESFGSTRPRPIADRNDGVAGAAAGASSLRIAANAARELQARAVAEAPPVSDEPPISAYADLFDEPAGPPDVAYCAWCSGPCTGQCEHLPNAPRRQAVAA